MARSFANGVSSLFKPEADICPIDPWYKALTSFEFLDASKLSHPDASRINKTCSTIRSTMKKDVNSIYAALILISLGQEIETLVGFRLPHSEDLVLALDYSKGISNIVDFPRILLVEQRIEIFSKMRST